MARIDRATLCNRIEYVFPGCHCAEERAGVPKILSVLLLDAFVGMPRVRQQDALLPGFEVFHHFEDNDIHVMVVAVRRLVVERESRGVWISDQ